MELLAPVGSYSVPNLEEELSSVPYDLDAVRVGTTYRQRLSTNQGPVMYRSSSSHPLYEGALCSTEVLPPMNL